MSHPYHQDERLTPGEVLELRATIAGQTSSKDNTTERGRRLVRRFANQLGAGGTATLRARRVLRELNEVPHGERADPADSRRVGAVLACIHKGIITDDTLAQLEVGRWSESTERTTWQVSVPDDWPEVVDDA